MNRRQLMAASSVALLMPVSAVTAGDGERIDYSPEAYARLLASEKPFMLDFYAPW